LRYISLLRGINVSGQKKVEMVRLRKCYEKMGFSKVLSYIQTGNIIFESNLKKEELVRKIEKALKKEFGFEIKVLIRDVNEIKNIIKKCPYKSKDNFGIYITFLSDKVIDYNKNEIEGFKSKFEKYAINGSEIYMNILKGYGKTKLSNSFFEKKLKLVATTRNFNTAKALLDMISKD